MYVWVCGCVCVYVCWLNIHTDIFHLHQGQTIFYPHSLYLSHRVLLPRLKDRSSSFIQSLVHHPEVMHTSHCHWALLHQFLVWFQTSQTAAGDTSFHLTVKKSTCKNFASAADRWSITVDTCNRSKLVPNRILRLWVMWHPVQIFRIFSQMSQSNMLDVNQPVTYDSPMRAGEHNKTQTTKWCWGAWN